MEKEKKKMEGVPDSNKIVDEREKFFINKGLLDAGIPKEIVFGVGKGVGKGVDNTEKDVSHKLYSDNLSKSVLEASRVSHAFRFVVTLVNPKNWSRRRDILVSKGLNVELRAGIGRVFKTVFNGHKVWLADKSITVYFPDWKKYFVDEARFGYNFAVEDLRIFLDDLAKFCDSDFLIDGAYHFRCAGQHHALIFNSLAKMYNRKKEKLHIYDSKGELWLLIDNSRRESLRMDDLETVNAKTAVRDNDVVVANHFNDLRDNDSDVPSVTKVKIDDLRYAVDKLVAIQERILVDKEKTAQDELYHAENLKSHTIAIRELAFQLKRLNRRKEVL